MAQAGLTFAREIEQNIFYKELPEPIGTQPSGFRGRRQGVGGIEGYLQIGRGTHSTITKLFKGISTAKSGLLLNFGSKKHDIQKIDSLATESPLM